MHKVALYREVCDLFGNQANDLKSLIFNDIILLAAIGRQVIKEDGKSVIFSSAVSMLIYRVHDQCLMRSYCGNFDKPILIVDVVYRYDHDSSYTYVDSDMICPDCCIESFSCPFSD